MTDEKHYRYQVLSKETIQYGEKNRQYLLCDILDRNDIHYIMCNVPSDIVDTRIYHTNNHYLYGIIWTYYAVG